MNIWKYTYIQFFKIRRRVIGKDGADDYAAMLFVALLDCLFYWGVIMLCYQPIWLLFFLSINREMKVTVGTINKYDTAPLIVLISIQAHLLLSITRKIYVR